MRGASCLTLGTIPCFRKQHHPCHLERISAINSTINSKGTKIKIESQNLNQSDKAIKMSFLIKTMRHKWRPCMVNLIKIKNYMCQNFHYNSTSKVKYCFTTPRINLSKVDSSREQCYYRVSLSTAGSGRSKSAAGGGFSFGLSRPFSAAEYSIMA